MKRGAKGLALGTVIAGIAGYLAGVLTAPKSGRETREQIRTATNSSITESEKQLKKLHTELTELLNEAQAATKQLKGKTRESLEDSMVYAEKTKAKVREVLSAIHEGEASDKDLQKAAKEAAKAIDHIKKYVQK